MEESVAADAVPALREALNDRSPNVRQSAAIALGNIGQLSRPAVPDLIEALKGKTIFAAYGLGRIGPASSSAIPALLDALQDTRTPR